MPQVKHHRIGKVGMRRLVDKGQRHSQYRDMADRGQAVGFGLRQIDDKREVGGIARVGAQEADTPRLDQAATSRRALCNEGFALT